MEMRIGLADKADLAVLAAHVAEPVRVIRDGKEALRELPMTVLCRNAELLQLLHLWGVRTLGQFNALPRAEIETMKVDGLVVVTCQFCHRVESFDDQALDALYAA